MSSKERILCAARRQRPDMVPVAPYMGNHGARVAGVPIGEYCRSGRRMAQAQYRAWQVYGQDAMVAQSDNYSIAEGFGVQVQHYDDSTPTLKTPAVQNLGDIDRLRVPNPHRDGRMVDRSTAKQRVGRRVCLMGHLDPVECLWRGTPAQVTKAARAAIAAAGQDGGFILGSGCEVPVGAPTENVRAMIQTAREQSLERAG